MFSGRSVTLGASSVAVDRDFAGDGWVRFAREGGGTQTVNVTGARTIENAIFDGSMEMSFGSGASLKIGSGEVGNSANVALMGRAAAKGLLRIGTSKCLSADDLEKFTCNGETGVRQLGDGRIVTKPGLMIVFQ